MNILSKLHRSARQLPSLSFSAAALLAGLTTFAAPQLAMATAVPLADQPPFATNNVPGNLALVLSVEFPTAISVAHTNRNYDNTQTYLGIFDPAKCYMYRYTDGTSTDNYFYPSGMASSTHICTGTNWGGNFLNWATMQTIDPFRWALTGGYRIIDTTSLTVLEKAWGTSQNDGDFPNFQLTGGLIPGATPFPATAGTLAMRIAGMGNKMRFYTSGAADPNNPTSFAAKFWNNQSESGTPVLTRTDPFINFNWDPQTADPAVNHDNISVQWIGTVKAKTAGNYQFRTRADDTVKVTINGAVAINQTQYDGLNNYYSPTYNVSAGTNATVQVDFTQGVYGSSVVLEWLTPGATDWVPVGGLNTGNGGDFNAASTNYSGSSTVNAGQNYDMFIRVKVCDSTVGLEANCRQYGSNYKPEGLMQQYANKIRYSAFSYLNDSDLYRDGGVLRARQNFIGPTAPVPGSAAVTNPFAEWDASTGIMKINPAAADAANTSAIMGLSSSQPIVNSGAMNYVNKFGEITPGSYKTYDNVSELYYAAIRYFKNLPDVPYWHQTSGYSTAASATITDNFPVIVNPPDPILYSCQRNFILGIGDVNTHADTNLPNRQNGMDAYEPSLEPEIAADTSVDASAAMDKVGQLEGMGNLSTMYSTGSAYAGWGIAGLAYDSHVRDIRPDVAGQSNTTGLQTIDTYWVDVQEYQTYLPNNQYYLATKYGGFVVPPNYNAYGNTTPLPLQSWSTSGQSSYSGGTAQPKPDNYYSGSQPDLMTAGLSAAFSKISNAISAYTTSFATSLPQVAQYGNSSFSSKYDPTNWAGEIIASNLSFDPTTGAPSLTPTWVFTDLFANQVAGSGWDTNRNIVTWNGSAGVPFRSNTIASSDLAALDTYYSGTDSSSFLNYLRGDRTNETSSVVSGSTHAYRDRIKMLGDIVGSKAKPAGAPSYPFADFSNPGYSAFKTTWAGRRTVVYSGSNDGMMHAINGALVFTSGQGLEYDSNAGEEMFTYIPRALFQGPNGTPKVDGLASLALQNMTHHYMVNATPSVYDIDMARTSGSGTTTPNWKSVLIGGLGHGGRAYYAMDVTDPVSMANGNETNVASKVLWEFTDSALGFSFGDPIVAKVKKYGWVVILPSGYGNADGQGYFLIVNPRTGALLEKVSTGVGTAANEAGLANINGFVVDSSDGTIDSAYGADLLGNLWRLDLTGTAAYPTPKKIASLTDLNGNPEPVTSRLVIEIHPTLKKRFVMVGTGRLLASSDILSSQTQTFWAITDGTNAQFNTTLTSPLSFPIGRSQLAANSNALTGVTFNPSTQMGWYEDIGTDVASGGVAWRMLTEPTTLTGSVAFAAILPGASVCSPSGDSRVYGRDYAGGTTTVKLVNSAGVMNNVLFVPQTGNVTDLKYLSVRGKAELIAGTDTGSVTQIQIHPINGLSMRRLNWRELQMVN